MKRLVLTAAGMARCIFAGGAQAQGFLEGLTGDAWMQRATQHRLCMGPTWGEGG